MTIPPAASAAELLAALNAYRIARQALLIRLGLPSSNRDPLAEFSEHLVAALTGGTLATSRVQARYDLVLGDSTTVQVRYLANPAGPWVNEHLVHRIPRRTSVRTRPVRSAHCRRRTVLPHRRVSTDRSKPRQAIPETG